MPPTLPSSAAFLLVVGLLTAAISERSAAAEIVDTIGLAGTDVAHSISSLPAAQSFVANGSSIGDVELELDRNSSATGSVVITIASNSANSPGVTLDTIYTLPESAIPVGTETLFDFNDLAVNNLSNGTTYWIEAARNGSVSTNVFVTASTPAVGAGATDYWTGSRTLTSSAITLCVSTDAACDAAHPALPADTFAGSAAPPVSEPATIAVIGVGLAALALMRRRPERQAVI